MPEMTDLLDPEAFTECALHTETGDRLWHLIFSEVGRISILDRETGWGCGCDWPIRDIETGFKDPEGRFWLASGNFDIRREGVGMTYAQAIDLIKSRANNCNPDRDSY